MRIIIALLLFLCISFAQAQEKYHRIKILLDGESLEKLMQNGIPVDHGDFKKNQYFISDFSDTEWNKIKALGYQTELLINDVSKHYEMQNSMNAEEKSPAGICPVPAGGNAPTYSVPQDFELGSMGGYFTYQEFLDHLDTMFTKYPNLITERDTISEFTSVEGRPIYWLKISDNPTSDEAEPEVLYTAVHHAREPGSLSQLIYYMYYLLENYGTNEEVTYLVDNTEMYFVPMINPDGYVYNENTNPSGGGMWRKNRRVNGDGSFGVDLNRNYGYHWGYDDSGSSPDPTSDTYRGSAEFSEPETQAVKQFCEDHEFRIALNYHTYGNLLIYPWGYEYSIYTPDSAVFVEYAQELTKYNHYNFGTGDQTVGYITNGDSDDWMYGDESGKPKILSCTPEIGEAPEGFWPPEEKVIPNAQNNVWQNIALAKLAGKYALFKDASANVISSDSLYLPYQVKCLGLDTPATFTVSVDAISANIVSVTVANGTYSDMQPLQTALDSLLLEIDTTSISNGDEIIYVVKLNNGIFEERDTVIKTFGELSGIFSDNADNMNNWTSNLWGVCTSDYYTTPSSIADSPIGNYSDNTNRYIRLTEPLDLSLANSALLTYFAKWETEPGYDYAQVLGSIDEGQSWTPLCGKYTKPGNSLQDEDQPLYDGFQTFWVFEEVSLNEFIGQPSVTIGFRLKSDGGVNEDGFFFDDLNISIDGQLPNALAEKPNVLVSVFIYPNPTKNILNIETGEKENYTFSLREISGKALIQNTFTEKISLDLFGVANGLYILTLHNSRGETLVQKVSVVR